jgi:hypothetical protein
MKNNMEATLSFDLDDEQDAQAHMRCVKSLDMALALWTFAGKMRELVDTSEDGKWINEKDVWEAWEEVMDTYKVNIHELVT